MLDSLLRHATKDFYGPLFSVNPNGQTIPAYAYRFQDSYSLMGWGKMPDAIQGRALAQSAIHHALAVQLKSADVWKEFLRSADALTFRKAATSIAHHIESSSALVSKPQESIGSMLNELGERFPIPHFYLGMLTEQQFKQLSPNQQVSALLNLTPLGQEQLFPYGLIAALPEAKVPVSTILGKTVRDYTVFKEGVLPFEFKCHFELNEARNLNPLVIPKIATALALKPGTSWDFPLIEVLPLQNPFHETIGLNEMLWMTKLPPALLQKTILTAAWIASFLRYVLKKKKFTLIEANIKLSMDLQGNLTIASFQSFDELRVEEGGRSFHIDEALKFYQKTNWFESVLHAQKMATQQGLPEWKRLCVETPPWLEQTQKQAIEKQMGELLQCFSESKQA